MLKFVGSILSGLLKYFPKNRAILVQKLGEEKKEKKSSMAIKPEGGGGVRP